MSSKEIREKLMRDSRMSQDFLLAYLGEGVNAHKKEGEEELLYKHHYMALQQTHLQYYTKSTYH
jgi:hypothetical protein